MRWGGGRKKKQEQKETYPKQGDKNLYECSKQNKRFKREGPVVIKGQNTEESGTGVSGCVWVYVCIVLLTQKTLETKKLGILKSV